MKALATLICAALVAGAATPAEAVRASFSSHAIRLAGPNGGHRGSVHVMGHNGGGFADRREGRRFDSVGGLWADGYADPSPVLIEPAPSFRGHFEGAAWVEPGGGVVSAPNPGPRILYLNGEPKRAGKTPIVIYGTYK